VTVAVCCSNGRVRPVADRAAVRELSAPQTTTATAQTSSAPARRDEAVALYERAIPLAEQLARASGDSPASADQRASCHNNFASILGRDRFELAKTHYKQAIELRERPDVLALPGMRYRLAESIVNLGVIHWKEHDYAPAAQRLRQAEKLLLAPAREARNADREVTIALAQVNVNSVGLLWETRKHEEAIARASSAIQALEPYLRIEPNDQVASDLCLKLYGNRSQALGALGKNREAVRDWEHVVELAPQPVPPRYRLTMALMLLTIGEIDRALSQADLAKQGGSGSSNDLYDLACVYSRAAMAVQTDQNKKVDERSRLVESHIAGALAALEKAAQAGFFRDAAMRNHAQTDSDLEILHGRDEFRRLLRSEPVTPNTNPSDRNPKQGP
jgi:tetratricopeptide (TPR) repeat protein